MAIVHSDRGGHYRWPGWLCRVAYARLVRSMSRKACSPNNAVREGCFGRLKTEMFYPNDWRSTTIERFIDALKRYHSVRALAARFASIARNVGPFLQAHTGVMRRV
jgi:transposase InsO family protein